MAMTLKAAAEAVGMNKSSLLRSIQRGKISAVKDEAGEWQIEPVELYLGPLAECCAVFSSQRARPTARPGIASDAGQLRGSGTSRLRCRNR